MTDFNLDEFFDQAEAWRDGDTRQIPGYLAERLFIDKARMPPLPGSGQTVTREQFQYREYIEREMERRWLAACHATPGTNMRNFTGLGNCFRNAGYNIASCQPALPQTSLPDISRVNPSGRSWLTIFRNDRYANP